MSETEHHAESMRTYVLVLLALLVLTGATVWIATVHLGSVWNEVAALGIATVKAGLVILFFMHVYRATVMTRVVVLAGFFWLALFLVLLMPDYASRGWLGIVGK